ncbi:hypothetical protein B0A50_03486 [Salinomyces thailandicus]|uniref:Uncharacterized protein n=1 Tax=Salinomyces thailandicus TaxID=706561 RepID=A0A4U0U383_9PEZI|nr:hypothetical protein B0A50_03486 [Salinomyces thailandica]
MQSTPPICSSSDNALAIVHQHAQPDPPCCHKPGSINCPFGLASCSGYPPSRPVFTNEDIPRNADDKVSTINVLQTLSIQSPAAYRQQLITNFYEAHFPRGISTRFIVFDKIVDWARPRSAAMAAAIDCLLLVQLSIGTGDVATRLECKKRHHVAVQLVPRALQRPKAAYDDGLIAAVDALGICEIFTESADGHGAWRMHTRGLSSLLKARGPKVLRNRFTRNVYIDCLPSALMDALLARKPLVFAEPAWQEEMEKQLPLLTSSL